MLVTLYQDELTCLDGEAPLQLGYLLPSRHIFGEFLHANHLRRVVDLGGTELTLRVLETHADEDGAVLRPIIEAVEHLKSRAANDERHQTESMVKAIMEHCREDACQALPSVRNEPRPTAVPANAGMHPRRGACMPRQACCLDCES